MDAFFKGGSSPVMYRFSMFRLPPTLRAVRGCSLYVHYTSTNSALRALFVCIIVSDYRINPLSRYTGRNFAF